MKKIYIKINGEYFKEVSYKNKSEGRFGGHTQISGVTGKEDVKEIITTKNKNEASWHTKRGIGGVIGILANVLNTDKIILEFEEY